MKKSFILPQSVCFFAVLLSILLFSDVAVQADDGDNILLFVTSILAGNTQQPGSCDSSHLNLCTEPSSCTAAGGYWWSNNTCNSTPESSGLGTVVSGGQIWMDRNLGAVRVGTSINDTQAYGDLYQWGRGTDGHEKRDSPITSTTSSSDTPGHGNFIAYNFDWRTPSNDNLWQGVSGINNPCPAGFRLPTDAEWEIELATWSSNNAAGAFASPLKLVVAGYRTRMGALVDPESGYYCSSTPKGIAGGSLIFDGDDALIGGAPRAGGQSVRCIKD